MFLTNGEDFKKFARGLIYVFIAVFPFLLYKGFIFNGTSTRALNLILIVSVLAVWFGVSLFGDKVKFSILKSPIIIGLVALFASLLISSLFGSDFHTSFWSKITRMEGIYYFLHLGMFYLFVVMLFRGSKDLRKLIKIFLISTGIFSLGSLLSKDGFGLIFANREWSGFTFGNSSFAAMYLFAGFILSIYYVFSIEKTIKKWWHNLIPLVFILNPYLINMDLWRGKINIFQNPLSIIGGAQASSYALIFSTFFLLVIWGVSKIDSVKIRRGFIWSFVIFGILVSAFAMRSLVTPGGFIQGAYLKQASASRPLIWSLSEKAISEKPVLGWGVDNFDRAYESHYDNQVMEISKGGEAWFDRAHNIFIDRAIETGYVGVFAYILAFLAVIGSMIYVIFYSKEKNIQALAVFVSVYFVGHLMELQTAFDTTISYIPLAIMAGIATLVFHNVYSGRNSNSGEWQVPDSLKFISGGLIIAVFTTLFFVGTIPILRSQIASGNVRTAGYSEKRLEIYPVIFNSPSDLPGLLNRTAVDLQRGIGLTPELLADQKRVEGFKKEFELFVSEYEKYLSLRPDGYRTQIDLTNLYIYERLFDVDSLQKALESSDKAIKMVPQAPQAYWQKAVAYLYQAKFDLAREWAKKAYDLNPNIEESQNLKKYIDDSIKTFPEIDLYNFKMI